MAHVIFYEKPGCGGNAKQKALLTASGHTLDVRNLLAAPWTAPELESYFGARPVAQWFNMAAPRVKSGEIDPATLTREQALAAMLAEPLLIRRPLMESGGRREAGFEHALVDAWLGLTPEKAAVGEGCASATMAPCRTEA